MLNSDYDPYEKLMQLELDTLKMSHYLEQVSEQLQAQGALIERITEGNRQCAGVIEQLYNKILELDQRIQLYEGKK